MIQGVDLAQTLYHVWDHVEEIEIMMEKMQMAIRDDKINNGNWDIIEISNQFSMLTQNVHVLLVHVFCFCCLLLFFFFHSDFL